MSRYSIEHRGLRRVSRKRRSFRRRNTQNAQDAHKSGVRTSERLDVLTSWALGTGGPGNGALSFVDSITGSTSGTPRVSDDGSGSDAGSADTVARSYPKG